MAEPLLSLNGDEKLSSKQFTGLCNWKWRPFGVNFSKAGPQKNKPSHKTHLKESDAPFPAPLCIWRGNTDWLLCFRRALF